MRNNKRFNRIVLVLISLAVLQLSVSCTRLGDSIDPGLWGYDARVTYDALGGAVNARDVRHTYYMMNSYIFEPSGTTNMLIQPVKDGFILAGWYTAKEDITDENGNVAGYSFKAGDRWDFNEDRVQGDMMIYARWVEQGRVSYVDADTGEVMFAKNITTNSPIQVLSGAAEQLISRTGYTMLDYYADEACTIPYDFSAYEHAELKPSDQALYDQLYSEFPQYIVPYTFTEPVEEETDPEIDQAEADPQHYLKKLGYEIITDDPATLAEIRARKDDIIDQSIAYYIENTANRIVYLKYIEGRYIRVSDISQLRQGSNYSLLPSGADGLVLLADIDFSGTTLETVELFSGTIYGNGYSLSNITLNVTSRRADMATEKSGGLFLRMEQASIQDLTIENLTININVRSGIAVTVGALAVEAVDTHLRAVHFQGIRINSGNGDDGEAPYILHDLIVSADGYSLENVTGADIMIEASETAEVNSFFNPPVTDTAEMTNDVTEDTETAQDG